jgi:trimeric autotransporter adhesin
MKKIIFPLLSFLLLASCTNVCDAQSGIITTVAGTYGVSGYGGDGGPATAAVLCSGDKSLAVDAMGNLYICDDGRIRMVNSSGVITTIAGTGLPGYSGDGGPATAADIYGGGCSWAGITFDGLGNIYFAAQGGRIRKINSSGIISTIAGDGSMYFNGDGIPATNAGMEPVGLVVDGAGNIIFCDFQNNRVRKIDPAGIITTIAGDGTTSYSGDGGPATAAAIANPNFVTIDSHGNIYVGMASYIRKIDLAGIITTVAGHFYGFSGDGGPATAAGIYQTYGLSVDGLDNIYFADEEINRVRVINTAGIINTIAGSGPLGSGAYSGDGGSATAAQMKYPSYTATDGAGNIYICDKGNDVIRKITFPSLSVNNIDFEGLNIYPNPTSTNVIITHAKGSWYVMNDVLGREVYSALISSDQQTINISNLPSGVYLAQTTGDNGLRKTTRIIKQ